MFASIVSTLLDCASKCALYAKGMDEATEKRLIVFFSAFLAINLRVHHRDFSSCCCEKAHLLSSLCLYR